MADYTTGRLSSNVEDRTGEPSPYPSWYMNVINNLDDFLGRHFQTAARRGADASWESMTPDEQKSWVDNGLNALSGMTQNPDVRPSTRTPDGTEGPGWAWPGMITEPLNALQRLHDNSFTEDRPSIFGSAVSSSGHDMAGSGAVTQPDWLEHFLRSQY